MDTVPVDQEFETGVVGYAVVSERKRYCVFDHTQTVTEPERDLARGIVSAAGWTCGTCTVTCPFKLNLNLN